MIRGNSKTSASSDALAAHRRAWLAGLLIYGVAAGGDFAYHLIGDLHPGNRAIGYPEVVVAFSAALFWPLDLVAMELRARAGV
jgi:hypothetical protein